MNTQGFLAQNIMVNNLTMEVKSTDSYLFCTNKSRIGTNWVETKILLFPGDLKEEKLQQSQLLYVILPALGLETQEVSSYDNSKMKGG